MASTAIPTSKIHIRWLRHLTRRMSVFLRSHLHIPLTSNFLQTVNEMRASYDALVDLFASFENFLSRLSIYAEIPPSPALTNVLVKIIVELLSTLALATKQVKQGKFSEFNLVVTTID